MHMIASPYGKPLAEKSIFLGMMPAPDVPSIKVSIFLLVTYHKNEVLPDGHLSFRLDLHIPKTPGVPFGTGGVLTYAIARDRVADHLSEEARDFLFSEVAPLWSEFNGKPVPSEILGRIREWPTDLSGPGSAAA